jgi:threonine/homoserine/homoserine lactone efflux protein
VIIALLVGIILGFVLAMPPGPIGVTAIRFGLYDNLKPGTHLAYGTSLMDLLYCLVAIFAASAATSAISSFSKDYPYIALMFQVTIVIGFILYGIINLRPKNSEAKVNELAPKIDNSKIVTNLKSKGPFLLGIGIALTNIPNPTFLPSLAWVSMNVHQFNLIENTVTANIMYAIGYAIGNFFWMYVLMRIVHHYKSRMSAVMAVRIRQFAGFTLIGLGTLLGYRIIMLTKWSEILRLVFVF